MNRPIRILAIGSLVLFLALLANINYLQFVSADSLNAKNGNRRVIDDEYSRDRGPILVAGDPIAESVPVDDDYEFLREYPSPFMYAHLTGFFSYTYGRRAVEESSNPILSGSDARLFVNRVIDLVGSRQPSGGSVSLTVRPAAQRAALEGLDALPSGFKGAVAAVDPQSGAVLAMVSKPSYDPNLLASHDFPATSKAYNELTDDPSDPMLNRATQETVPPGSTFKLVTAAAAIEELGLDPNSQVNGSAGITYPGGYTLPNLGGGSCGADRITLQAALEVSCNVSFADLAGKVGEEKMAEQAAKFGFGQDYLDGIEFNASRFKADGTGELEDAQLGQSGIGQFEIASTPLQMAMVTAGIANDGDVMEPYVVSEVRSPDLEVLAKTDPKTIDDQPAVSSETAQDLKQMMINVVTNGTAGVAAIPDVSVGAKTGTAQRSENLPPYSWFVSFAPAEDPEVAVAVMVDPSEDYTGEVTGGGLAGPIARSVMEAVLD